MHGRQRLASLGCVVPFEKIASLLRSCLRRPESIDHHNASTWPKEPTPIYERDLRLAQSPKQVPANNDVQTFLVERRSDCVSGFEDDACLTSLSVKRSLGNHCI